MITANKAREKAIKKEYRDIKRNIKKRTKQGYVFAWNEYGQFFPENKEKLSKLGYQVNEKSVFWSKKIDSSSEHEEEVSA